MTNPYADAADTMRSCIVSRAAAYRRLVISICALAVAAMAAASTLPLCALSLIPALILNHFRRDRHLVHRWRSGPLSAWASGRLRMDVLSTMLTQVSGMPADTVHGRLGRLPAGLWPGDHVLPQARPALQCAQEAIGRLADWDLGARTAHRCCNWT